MADMTVQEPDEIDKAVIDASGLGNFAAIVYQKDQTNPGLKQLGFLDMKEAFDYDSYKSDNIAKLCGFPKGNGSDHTKYDYDGDIDAPANTVLGMISNLATNTGVSAEGTVQNSLNGRVGALETSVGDSTSGLRKEVTDCETAISGLQDTVGNPSSPASGTLCKKVADNETAISGLETAVGDSNSGLTKRVGTLETTVSDPSTGLVKEVTTLKSTVGNSSDVSGDTLWKKMNDLNCAYKFQKTVMASDVASIFTDSAVFLPGMVWRCGQDLHFNYPSTGNESNHYDFYEGVNFAYDAPLSNRQYGTFHTLGGNFNASGIDDVANRFKEDIPTSGWVSTSKINKAGTYLISGMGEINDDAKTFAFIAHFDENGYLEGTVINLGGYENIFSDANAVVTLNNNVTFANGNCINVLRLGA